MVMCLPLFSATIGTSMEHPAANFHDELRRSNAKARPFEKAGLRSIYDLGRSIGSMSEPLLLLDQPRVRERIMKLSNVYSATCHHRYSSER
jgi:hypothetical protein